MSFTFHYILAVFGRRV